MNRRHLLSLPTIAAARAVRPNIVALLAEDLCWADIGCHGGEMQTPNIDGLAHQGAQFDRFYAYPVCSPTLSGLVTVR